MRRTALLLAVALASFTSPAFAQEPPSTGGVSLLFGPGFSPIRNPPYFQVGPKGWLWLGGGDKAHVGLVLPVTFGLRSYRTRGLDHYENTVDFVPGVRGALAIHHLIRPYAELGVGLSVPTHSRYIDDSQILVDSETWVMPVIRTAVGLDLTPRRLDPLIFTFEAIALHARLGPAYPGGGVTLMTLFGIGFEL